MNTILPSHRWAGMILEIFDIIGEYYTKQREGEDDAKYEKRAHGLKSSQALVRNIGEELIRNTTTDGRYLHGGYIVNHGRVKKRLSRVSAIFSVGLDGKLDANTGIPLLLWLHNFIEGQLALIDDAIQSYSKTSNMYITATKAREIIVNQLQNEDYALEAVILYLYYLRDLVYGYRTKDGGKFAPLPAELCE